MARVIPAGDRIDRHRPFLDDTRAQLLELVHAGLLLDPSLYLLAATDQRVEVGLDRLQGAVHLSELLVDGSCRIELVQPVAPTVQLVLAGAERQGDCCR